MNDEFTSSIFIFLLLSITLVGYLLWHKRNGYTEYSRAEDQPDQTG